MKELVERLWRERRLKRMEYVALLTHPSRELLDYIHAYAREVAVENFGKAVHVRGLIELSNYCRNNCYYCGIRQGNHHIERYRLTIEQIMNCCRLGEMLGCRTFVLQGGEDPVMTDRVIEELIGMIRREFPEIAVTLSLGERSRDAYQRFFDAGANRYLLRHETADRDHYAHLHPPVMSFDNRMKCLFILRDIGYQVGAGMMVGSPGQLVEHLVYDLLFLEYFRPAMIGLGPFIPHTHTPLASYPPGSVDITLMLISILRLMFPRALIPAVTSLATLDSEGYKRGILAGANVVMANLSPVECKSKYALYNDKISSRLEPVEVYNELKGQLESIGYYFSDSRGDYA